MQHPLGYVRTLLAGGATVTDASRNRHATGRRLKAHTLEIAYALCRPTRLQSKATTSSWDAVVRRHVAITASRLWSPKPAPDNGTRSVALLVEPGASFVCALGAVWACGRIAVPLSHSNPATDLAHAVQNSGARTIICTRSTVALARKIAPASTRLIVVHDRQIGAVPTTFQSDLERTATAFDASLQRRSGAGARFADADALIIFTSGTTGKPKGVVHTFASVHNQIQVLQQAWKWTKSDSTLCTLPLHHVHGLINVVGCSVTAGAKLTFLHPFNAAKAFAELAGAKHTVFMAVPPIYSRLQTFAESAPPQLLEAFRKSCISKARLFVSGSAALPLKVRQQCETFLAGHVILERYGMTEIGMALSQPLEPAADRVPGTVGKPLPTVQCRVATNGELLVASPSVFNRYWLLPEHTRKEFLVDNGGLRWFKTGDSCATDEAGNYKILGRMSADILKVNAFKVSALEIENYFLDTGLVQEIAVFAASSPPTETSDWVTALCVMKDQGAQRRLCERAANELPKYKRPHQYIFTDAIPRNAMGKVNKKALAAMHPAAPNE